MTNAIDTAVRDLFSVVTLLHAALADLEHTTVGADDADSDGLTSPSSRAVALLILADQKTRSAIRALVPD